MKSLFVQAWHSVKCIHWSGVVIILYVLCILFGCVTHSGYCDKQLSTDPGDTNGVANDDHHTASSQTKVTGDESLVGDQESRHKDNEQGTKMQSDISPLDLYRLLFREKRKSHREAVKAILNLDRYDKQYNMVKLILDKMFATTQEAKVLLMEAGFTPGDPFPVDEKLQDVLSMIVENTVFFGDILLHLPAITHDLLKRNKQWDLMARWGVGFCNDTKIYEKSELKLLNLMAQELGIIEKDPDFINPYKVTEKDLQKEVERLLKDSENKSTKNEKKKKKERKRGPRLSSIPHTEL